MRKFDVADRDPARTVVELQDFELTLRRLFVEGYIAVAPAGWSSSRDDPAASRDRGAEGDPAAPRDRGNEAKTLTHVIFDELREVNELRYGDKVHVFFRDTDKDLCKDSIRRIGEVVKDCLARVRADFAPLGFVHGFRGYGYEAVDQRFRRQAGKLAYESATLVRGAGDHLYMGQMEGRDQVCRNRAEKEDRPRSSG